MHLATMSVDIPRGQMNLATIPWTYEFSVNVRGLTMWADEFSVYVHGPTNEQLHLALMSVD